MIDPRTRQTSANTSQVRIDDGRIRVLISTEASPVRNWLDARGYRSGLATWRASVAEQPPAPVVTKIRLNDLDDYFGSEDHITDEERSRVIAARIRHCADRETP